MTEEKTIKKVVQESHENLPASISIYLNQRGITDDCIKKFKLGYGEFYGKKWITIPINDHEGEYIFVKLRRDPNDQGNPVKFRYYPNGIDGVATIYGWEVLMKSELVVICEGEMDRLILMDHGIPAISSTSGASTFKQEWLDVLNMEKSDIALRKIYVCFDNDEAGRKGAERVERMVAETLPHIEFYRISLPDDVGPAGDITNYFVDLKGNLDDLFSKYCTKSVVKPELKPVKMDEPFEGKGERLTAEQVAAAKQVDCANFADIVKEEVGRKWALCPYHNEETPSFCCYPGDKGFYCYGCGESGDTIKLVQTLKDLNFVDAVKYILNI